MCFFAILQILRQKYANKSKISRKKHHYWFGLFIERTTSAKTNPINDMPPKSIAPYPMPLIAFISPPFPKSYIRRIPIPKSEMVSTAKVLMLFIFFMF